jgi:hypothetical protein
VDGEAVMTPCHFQSFDVERSVNERPQDPLRDGYLARSILALRGPWRRRQSRCARRHSVGRIAACPEPILGRSASS